MRAVRHCLLTQKSGLDKDAIPLCFQSLQRISSFGRAPMSLPEFSISSLRSQLFRIESKRYPQATVHIVRYHEPMKPPSTCHFDRSAEERSAQRRNLNPPAPAFSIQAV